MKKLLTPLFISFAALISSYGYSQEINASMIQNLSSDQIVIAKEALESIAAEAIKIKSGARGLRAILEDVLLDPMYDVPTYKDIVEVIIDKKTITQYIDNGHYQYNSIKDTEFTQNQLKYYINIFLYKSTIQALSSCID